VKKVDMVVSPQTDCAGGGVVCKVTPTGPASPPAPLRMARGVVCEVTPIRLLTLFLGIFFSHRAHRVHWAFLRTFRAHRTPSAYRVHRGLSTNISCNALWYRL